MPDDRLKPCAHCGHEAALSSVPYMGHMFWRVVCTGCGVGTWCDAQGLGHVDGPGRQLAILEWNSRTDI
jgi:transcription elongation factor Elf1